MLEVYEMNWHCVEISDPDYRQIQKIKETLGYSSINQFVQEAVRQWLEKKSWEYEKKKNEEEERIVERHEHGGPSIGIDQGDKGEL